MGSIDFSLHYTAFTLVDITETGVTKGDSPERDQQRNWETVLQAIGLGAQPMNVTSPTPKLLDLDELEFGEFYKGEHLVWGFSFTVEHRGIFATQTDSVGRLKSYFNEVPIITGLDETARFMLPIFYCEGAIRNIYFISGTDYIKYI